MVKYFSGKASMDTGKMNKGYKVIWLQTSEHENM